MDGIKSMKSLQFVLLFIYAKIWFLLKKKGHVGVWCLFAFFWIIFLHKSLSKAEFISSFPAFCIFYQSKCTTWQFCILIDWSYKKLESLWAGKLEWASTLARSHSISGLKSLVLKLILVLIKYDGENWYNFFLTQLAPLVCPYFFGWALLIWEVNK